MKTAAQKARAEEISSDIYFAALARVLKFTSHSARVVLSVSISATLLVTERMACFPWG